MNDSEIRSYIERDLNSLLDEFCNSDRWFLHRQILMARRDRKPEDMLTYLTFQTKRRSNWRDVFPDWFTANAARIHELVCVKWQYCIKREEGRFNDQVSFVASLSDVVAVLTMGVPPVLLATILLKLGLDKFCGCTDTATGAVTEYSCGHITKSGRACSRRVGSRGIHCFQHKKS